MKKELNSEPGKNDKDIKTKKITMIEYIQTFSIKEY